MSQESIGHVFNYTPISSAEVKGRVDMPLLPLWVFMAWFRVNIPLELRCRKSGT
jgi:hypothetical protein